MAAGKAVAMHDVDVRQKIRARCGENLFEAGVEEGAADRHQREPLGGISLAPVEQAERNGGHDEQSPDRVADNRRSHHDRGDPWGGCPARPRRLHRGDVQRIEPARSLKQRDCQNGEEREEEYPPAPLPCAAIRYGARVHKRRARFRASIPRWSDAGRRCASVPLRSFPASCRP